MSKIRTIVSGFGSVSLALLVVVVSCPPVKARSGSHPLQQQETLETALSAEPLEQVANDVLTHGDAIRGASVYYRLELNCRSCHEPAASGRRLGPSLAEKRDVRVEDLIKSVLRPSDSIHEGFESQLLLLEDGRQLSGILVAQNEETIVLDRIEEPDKPLEIPVQEVVAQRPLTVSMMPVGLINQLADRQEFLDLISYLNEVAVHGPTRAVRLRPATAAQAALPLPEYESRIDHRGLIESWNEESLALGERIYRLHCSSCHGDLEQEGSMPTSLRFATGEFKRGGDPYSMYQVLTHGYGMMIAQRWMVPREKYAVIQYIREAYVRPHNPNQFVAVDTEYLDRLPGGDASGPEPRSTSPWTAMDYGPSFINTIEVPGSELNIAQKGIVVRLDEGPGGVAAGSVWMVYEHDTLRMAAVWDKDFIDYEGIHFNGAHGRHPSVIGQIQFQNPNGPGWADPETGSFADTERVLGRDKRRYGPLPRPWARFHGFYRYGKQTILSYSVGKTTVLETPRLQFLDGIPVVTRTLNVGPRDRELIIQVAKEPTPFRFMDGFVSTESSAFQSSDVDKETFDGSTFFQSRNGDALDTHAHDFSIRARIRSNGDGTIWSKTRDQKNWLPDGQALFVRDRRLVFDIGWQGAVPSNVELISDHWHDVAMTWDAKSHQVSLFIDGVKCGEGNLATDESLSNSVIRIGATNEDFPEVSFFAGEIEAVECFDRLLADDETRMGEDVDLAPVLAWYRRDAVKEPFEAIQRPTGATSNRRPFIIADSDHGSLDHNDWIFDEEGNARLRIPAGQDPLTVNISMARVDGLEQAALLKGDLTSQRDFLDLRSFARGGPANWPEILETEVASIPTQGAYAIDVLTHPTDNPWNCRMRLTGVDFIPEEDAMVASAWDGSVWRIDGVSAAKEGDKLSWRRMAAGLFQPLGIKVRDGTVFVSCRDQIVALHDLNGDGEIDWHECFNSDHQVTEHFHEFAMGLQTDLEGNFYYAKSARHALPAIVPHHGTLIQVSADGTRTKILANGFRAANGVCVNPDGTFLVTDQEGHWMPKNRINWVRKGEFFGNMLGYHNVNDTSDDAMAPPLCWITNAFDRSPAELLWVDSNQWGPLSGALLSFSYGYGKLYVVPHEHVDSKVQGGMCAFDLPPLPTGIMRGRFHPTDGQLYCCGMYAWSSTQQQPGGLYRIRYKGGAANLPVKLTAQPGEVHITFSDPLDPLSVGETERFSVRTWGLKRTANYGSDHLDERDLVISESRLLPDKKTVVLKIPKLEPTWCMEIIYVLRDANGEVIENRIHNTIHRLHE